MVSMFLVHCMLCTHMCVILVKSPFDYCVTVSSTITTDIIQA